MTPKAMVFESRSAQTSAHLHTTRMKIEEDIITGLGDSDPRAPLEVEGRFTTYVPEELEVFDFDEVKSELGGLNWEG